MRFEFDVEEISQGGGLSWEAVDAACGHRVKLIDPYQAGEYPEIEAYLAQSHGFSGTLRYVPRLGDEFDQDRRTWTFRRLGNEVVVRDMDRTLVRLTRVN